MRSLVAHLASEPPTVTVRHTHPRLGSSHVHPFPARPRRGYPPSASRLRETFYYSLTYSNPASADLCLQGEPPIKKLARGDVPPFLLKSVEIGGPQTAFAFLKMWKLASLLVDKGGNYRAGSCKTHQNRGLGSCTMSVSPNMWISNIGSQPESPSYFLKMLVLGRPIRLRLWPK